MSHSRTIVIDAQQHRLGINWAELWRYRELAWILAARDVSVRYKQTWLGAAWAVLQPFANMAIFTVLLSRLAKVPSDGVPYPVFAFAGLTPWFLFANSVTQAGQSVIGASNLVQKVYFPRLLIPLAAIGAYLIDFGVSMLLLFAMMVYYRVTLHWDVLILPFLALGLVVAALGAGTWLAALTVAYRDFRFIVPFMVQLWMFVTPVVYPVSLVPERWQWLLFLNPAAGFIDGFRAALLGTPWHPQAIALSSAMAVLLFVGGVVYFRHVERNFADLV